MWHRTVCRKAAALRAVAGHAHFPAWTTENDTATFTAYEKTSTFIAFLCVQVYKT